ncbi:MAG TPA: hypothetical protein VHO90_04620 [Bacteroidales bacterium]|nr:hypothetical protein [Bacteroidales bacterium]
MKIIPLLFNKSRAAKTSWLSLGYEDDTPNGAFNTVFSSPPQKKGILTFSVSPEGTNVNSPGCNPGKSSKGDDCGVISLKSKHYLSSPLSHALL